MLSITIVCPIFNGSYPLTITAYRNGIPIENNMLTIFNPTDDDFGTYTVVVSTEHCGAAHAVSRILQEGQFLIKSYKIKINFTDSLIGLVSR